MTHLHPPRLVLGTLLLALAAACGPTRTGDEPDGGGPGDIDAGGEPDAQVTPVTRCDTPPPAAQSGVCDATGGSGGGVLLRGTVLAADQVLEGGSVLVGDDGRIACVACDCSDAAGFAAARRVDCADAVISPGLINPHDHMTFTEGAPISSATRYDHRHDWRGSLSTPQNPHGTGVTGNGMRWGEIRMVMGGVTSMVGSGAADGMVRNLDRAGAPLEGLDAIPVDFETFPLGDSNETFHANCAWSYKQTELEAAADSAFLPHIAEGIDDYAAEEFRCQSSSFGGGHDYTERNAAHIHGIGLEATDYLKMARDGTKLIWSPRSNISLYGMTAQVTLFARLGGVIALGTDWTYSGSIHSGRELTCADALNRDYYDSYFSDEDLWKMATINPAIATSTADQIGSIEVGKVADLTVFAAAPGEHHRAVIEAGTEDVSLVLRGGAPLYGEADTLAELGESCDAVDVCGAARALCATREFGSSYAQIAAAVTGAYPAFFCGAPAGEPSCVPSRPGQYTGAITADDLDGDGLTGAADNCARVFNPIRPIDGGAQPDADGDGQGDPCDPTPLPADLDDDGMPNPVDNCPWDANPTQDDGDGDAKGDACDFCPLTANREGVCPAAPPTDATITGIQMGGVAAGTAVGLSGVVVTGVAGKDVFVQDPEAGPTHAGIHVFLSAASTTAAVGDLVDVQGEVQEYFDDTEIGKATVTRIGPAPAPIAPTPVTVAQAVSEPYEGMLVTLTDGAVTSAAYNCAADGGTGTACADTGLWEIGGAAGLLVYNRIYQGSDWTARVGNTPVTGVMGYRYNRRRLMPRTAADLP